MAFCLGVYYLLPFVRWDRGPNAPSQAVLVDFPNRRFYFFFIELWPQEVYYFTGLLIIAAMALFLMNAIGGRIWCGYLCPQTVWTDLFYAVERLIEGDRRERMRKAKSKLTPRRVGEITAKHAIWLFIAWWTGGAWVLYFADAPTLVKRARHLPGAGRRLCLDRHPHLHHLHARRPHARAGLHLHVPVAAHPGGADRRMGAQRHLPLRSRRAAHARSRRRGAARARACRPAIASIAANASRCARPASTSATATQLGCIKCGLCIDACDTVMAKIGRPTGLIAYDTEVNIKRRLEGKPPVYRFVRARTLHLCRA